MNATWITFMVFAAALFWWLSGWDSRVTGHDLKADLIRRLLRCVPTLILVGFGSWQFIKGGIFEGFVCVVLVLPITPFWVGCLSELSARGFHGLVDHSDHREYDARQVPRDLDRLGQLVREGRNEAAIDLCKQLRQSSEVSALAMETMLLQLYQETFADERIAASPALAGIQALRVQQRSDEAAARLESLLKQEPRNLAAALLLMRIRAQDFSRVDQALALVETLHRQPGVPPAFADYARRRVGEWSGAVAPRPKTVEGIESLLVDRSVAPAPRAVPVADLGSVEKLLAAGHLATAIEILENKVREQPQDFGSWLKLAEAHGVNCRDLARAGRIVEQIARNKEFSAEQIQLAKAKLKEWKAGSS